MYRGSYLPARTHSVAERRLHGSCRTRRGSCFLVQTRFWYVTLVFRSATPQGGRRRGREAAEAAQAPAGVWPDVAVARQGARSLRCAPPSEESQIRDRERDLSLGNASSSAMARATFISKPRRARALFCCSQNMSAEAYGHLSYFYVSISDQRF